MAMTNSDVKTGAAKGDAVVSSAVKSSDELAMDRTVLAAERTLMAWIRTSFSMTGFGFTVYNFLKAFVGQPSLNVRPYGPRNFGMVLIGLGTVSLLVAIVQHVGYMRQLGQPARSVWSLATIVAIFTVLIGVLAFISVVLRTGPF